MSYSHGSSESLGEVRGGVSLDYLGTDSNLRIRPPLHQKQIRVAVLSLITPQIRP